MTGVQTCALPISATSANSSRSSRSWPDRDRHARVPGANGVEPRGRLEGGTSGSGADLAELDRIAANVERIAKTVPGVSSALAGRLTGGRYVDGDIGRASAARYGRSVDIASIVSANAMMRAATGISSAARRSG